MLRKLEYSLLSPMIDLMNSVHAITIGKSELEKLYKAWTFATACKWFISKLGEYGLYEKLGIAYQLEQKLYVPPVMPFLRDNFYEDFWEAFIIIQGADKVEAVLDMPPYARIVPHERALPYFLYYSTVIIASQVTSKGMNNIDEESFDANPNMLATQIFQLIKGDIRRRNIDVFKEVVKYRKRIIEGREAISEVEAETEAKKLLDSFLGINSIDPRNPRSFSLHAILEIPVKILQPIANDNESYTEESTVVYDVVAHVSLHEKNFKVLSLTPFDKKLDKWIKRMQLNVNREIAFYGDPEMINRHVWEWIRNKLNEIVKYLYAETETVIFNSI